MAKFTDHQAEEWHRETILDCWLDECEFWDELCEAIWAGRLAQREAGKIWTDTFGKDLGEAVCVLYRRNHLGIPVKGVG